MGLNISCFCMMRNESPILEPFLDQAVEFFDALYLVDHSSSDNSVDIVRRRKVRGLELFSLISAGYPQSELATFLLGTHSKTPMRIICSFWIVMNSCLLRTARNWKISCSIIHATMLSQFLG